MNTWPSIRSTTILATHGLNPAAAPRLPIPGAIFLAVESPSTTIITTTTHLGLNSTPDSHNTLSIENNCTAYRAMVDGIKSGTSGWGGDDFFSSGADRFGPGSSMMNDMSSGFDRMMSTAFKGLNMAGPDPAELARMDSGQNCSMRMRQSKMVMGRTEDGTWAGKRMEKQMNMADGRIEVNENAQDIRMGGRAGGSSRYPPRNGNVRGNAEDWDPPPAYQGGGEENYGPEGYGPNMQQYQPGYQHPQPRHGGHPAALDQGGYGGYGEMVPGPRRQASVSRSRHSASGVDGYPDGGGRLQRRPSSRFDYGSELAHASRPLQWVIRQPSP
ncbi:hypothetical protein Pst134EB_001403 [Puccinia striiformis f. sp. tritici]|nr:hypothetical protein Pst134EB_001403 [Puccinia striiformis f. sp. tritici]